MVITGSKQIEQYLGLSWPTIRKLHYEQGLPLVRFGLKWALSTQQLEEWMAQRSKIRSGIPNEKEAAE